MIQNKRASTLLIVLGLSVLPNALSDNKAFAASSVSQHDGMRDLIDALNEDIKAVDAEEAKTANNAIPSRTQVVLALKKARAEQARAEQARAEQERAEQERAEQERSEYTAPIHDHPLVSKWHPCSAQAYELGIKHYRYEEAKPKDLVTVGSRKLHRDAAASLKKMKAAAKRDGVKLIVGSAFRSIKYQEKIIKRKKRLGQKDDKIYKVSAPAGHSEHSTGYAVDFMPIDSKFVKTAAYRWLQKNANKFNWEQSFTPAVSAKDGVAEESWHWRFVGTPEARELFLSKECDSVVQDNVVQDDKAEDDKAAEHETVKDN